MSVTADDIRALLSSKEDEHLECKEAKNRFEFEELVKYCSALANEGGGRVILGVTDQRPRRVVGSEAFRGELVPQDPNDEPASVLLERIRAEKARREIKGRCRRKKRAICSS